MNERGVRRTIYIMAVLLILSLTFIAFTAYKVFTLKPGESQVTTIGTVIKPTNNVRDATIDTSGQLVLSYEDGSQKTVGNIIGATGNAGPPPAQSEIALAVIRYCSDGRCDAKSPTAAEVAAAVYNYCTGNNACVGKDGVPGKHGAPATTEQIMTAVSQYCSDGRCAGAKGEPGTTGQPGPSTTISCVLRITTGNDTQYVAWKYTTEPDVAYRDLYKLPKWAEGSNCTDLRT